MYDNVCTKQMVIVVFKGRGAEHDPEVWKNNYSALLHVVSDQLCTVGPLGILLALSKM